MVRRLFALASACVIALGPSALGPVSAHCPNVSGYFYAGGSRTPVGGADGAKATIAWTDPNPCQESVNHHVSLLYYVDPNHWGHMQTGWIKYPGLTVKGFCEIKSVANGFYPLVTWSVVSVSHNYQVFRSGPVGNGSWQCIYDGVIKASKSVALMGFGTGQYVDTEGEAHSQHGQLGKMAPAALFWSAMQIHYFSTGTWQSGTPTLYAPDSPYGAAIPGSGQMQIWTNAH